jgi:hypothetical protein
MLRIDYLLSLNQQGMRGAIYKMKYIRKAKDLCMEQE